MNDQTGEVNLINTFEKPNQTKIFLEKEQKSQVELETILRKRTKESS